MAMSLLESKKLTTRRSFFKQASVGAAGFAAALGEMDASSVQADKKNLHRDIMIDVFCHFIPEKYLAAYGKKNSRMLDSGEAKVAPNTKIDVRLKLMDRYPGVYQVLTLANPPLDVYLSPEDAAEVAKIGNDELAELVDKYPDRFLGAVACVPMNNLDAAVKEADRALTRLGLKGIQIATRINAEPIEPQKFKPLWERMAKADLPIWIHPYTNEKMDPDGGRLSWPYDTAATMYRIVYSGVFNDYPNLKFITHHCGSMVPYFGKRVGRAEDFKRFYADTALYGNTDGLMLGYSFFGVDHILFGTDAPLPPKSGMTWQTVESVERMNISESEKRKIFTENAVSLLRLAI